METQRETLIKFCNDVDFANFLNDNGINIRKTISDKRNKLNNYNIWDESLLRELKKYNVPIKTEYSYYRDVDDTWKNRDIIKSTFGLNEKLNFTMQINAWYIKITSFNTTKREHVCLIRKIYKPAKKAGYNVSHECTVERTNSSC